MQLEVSFHALCGGHLADGRRFRTCWFWGTDGARRRTPGRPPPGHAGAIATCGPTRLPVHQRASARLCVARSRTACRSCPLKPSSTGRLFWQRHGPLACLTARSGLGPWPAATRNGSCPYALGSRAGLQLSGPHRAPAASAPTAHRRTSCAAPLGCLRETPLGTQLLLHNACTVERWGLGRAWCRCGSHATAWSLSGGISGRLPKSALGTTPQTELPKAISTCCPSLLGPAEAGQTCAAVGGYHRPLFCGRLVALPLAALPGKTGGAPVSSARPLPGFRPWLWLAPLSLELFGMGVAKPARSIQPIPPGCVPWQHL